jgi:hypothetical protein
MRPAWPHSRCPSILRHDHLSSPYLFLLRPRSCEVLLNPLPVLLWFFKLPDFALEIIDAGIRICQLTLKIFHFLAELLMLRIQFLQIL